MKILIVGLGSIGQRHAGCLQKIAGVDIAVLRTKKGTLKEASGFTEFYNLEDALAYGPDGVLISNPTSLHVSTALPFLQRGIKTLIEKPVADTAADAEKLAAYSEHLRVAYCVRFLPLINTIKEIAAQEKIYKLSFKRSYYLPKWHPYADYRTEYTAKKELGGGVIRTLSHEIDLMLYLFGEPVQTVGVTDKISPLEIDTDDFAFVSCKTAAGARINFELDFFSPKNVNIAELFTDKGKYTWDMTEMLFTPYSETVPERIYGQELFDIEKMYLRQAQDFITFISTGKSENADLATSKKVLQIIESIEK
ncbi:MAG TPA: Gfo/Idh/MocA family oxidoreductase [Ferruginibacter sp.]|nr:Gfo/Idh/MocA family oxidoreductase [Ferruginibacter sp.]HPH90314.1 Gfo/Idh/MocA family oxidoreductase [Ferruginibacter sp.]